MPSARIGRAVLTGVLLTAGATTAQSQDRPAATPADAQRIEQQVRAGLVDWFGPLPLPDGTFALTPAGDHYRMSVCAVDARHDRACWLASLAEDPGGTWVLDNFGVTAATLNFPDQAIALEPGEAAGLIRLDPAGTSPSTAEVAVRNTDVGVITRASTTLLHANTIEKHLEIDPAEAQRVNVDGRVGLLGVRLSSQRQGAVQFSAGARELRYELQAAGVPPQTLRALVRALFAGDGPAATPEAAAQMIASLARSATLDITGDRPWLVGSDPDVPDASLRNVHLSVSMDWGGGNLALSTSATAEHLFSSALAGRGVDSLLPERVSVTGGVTGIDASVAQRFLTLALTDTDAGPDDMASLFRHGLRFELANLQVTAMGAALHAQGSLVMTGPNQVHGSAEVELTNIDRIQAALAGQRGLPTRDLEALLIFLKGLGRTEGDATHWSLAYNGQTLLVNGQDVLALARRMGVH